MESGAHELYSQPDLGVQRTDVRGKLNHTGRQPLPAALTSHLLHRIKLLRHVLLRHLLLSVQSEQLLLPEQHLVRGECRLNTVPTETVPPFLAEWRYLPHYFLQATRHGLDAMMTRVLHELTLLAQDDNSAISPNSSRCVKSIKILQERGIEDSLRVYHSLVST